jgi:hypothetical protein
MKDTDTLTFTCPKCNGKRLEEKQVATTVYNTIKSITNADDGISIEWEGETDHEDGHIDRFQCNDCGYHLEDKDGFVVKDYEGLLEWLKNPADYLETVK